MAKFFDVSILIKEGMITYPGNPAPKISQYASIPSDKTNESLLCLGSHTGSHVDSKLHLQNYASGADSLTIDSFYGAAKVLDLTHVSLEIHREDFKGYSIEKGDIVLLKTKNSVNGFESFRKDFVHLKIDAAQYLVSAGVKTLGFDYLSVKKFGGDDEVHRLLIENLTLFEGLDLSGVAEGEYTFVGLPLRINCDGSPARVILIKY